MFIKILDMKRAKLFEDKLSLENYDLLHNSLKVARCQRTILDFMILVIKNYLKSVEDLQLMKKFCTLINHQDV